MSLADDGHGSGALGYQNPEARVSGSGGGEKRTVSGSWNEVLKAIDAAHTEARIAGRPAPLLPTA